MPELPEVQTVVDTLRPEVVNKKIQAVKVIEEKLISCPSLEEFKEILTDNKIIDVSRRGKYIIIELADGHFLVTHLRMTGRIVATTSDKELGKYDYILLPFTDGSELRLGSKRKFTRVYLVEDLAEAGSLTDLGPEPLSDEFTFAKFKEMIAPRRGQIKPLLLNQKFLAGLGNIYVDESLFISGIHPQRTADTLTDEELEKLHHAIRQVLAEGIRHRGTTKRDYVDASGEAGSYQDQLRVYDREDEECIKCDNQINRIKVGGRSSYFCPQCQQED